MKKGFLHQTTKSDPSKTYYDLIKEKTIIRNTDDCIEWTGSFDNFGYPMAKVGDKTYRVHRAIYIHFRGDPGEGKVIRHLCGNKQCTNVYHLRAGTYQENYDDRLTHAIRSNPKAVRVFFQGAEINFRSVKEFNTWIKMIAKDKKKKPT